MVGAINPASGCLSIPRLSSSKNEVERKVSGLMTREYIELLLARPIFTADPKPMLFFSLIS